MEGVAVFADAAGGEFGVLEGAAGFAGGEWFALGAFGAACFGRGEVAGEQDGFGAAAGEAFALAAGEGVQEVLDEGVQRGWVFAASGGAGEGFAADGECCSYGGKDAVAALTQ